MKSKEELNALKEEELEQVTGGNDYVQDPPCYSEYRSQKPRAGTCDVAIDHPECASCPSNPKNKALQSPRR